MYYLLCAAIELPLHIFACSIRLQARVASQVLTQDAAREAGFITLIPEWSPARPALGATFTMAANECSFSEKQLDAQLEQFPVADVLRLLASVDASFDRDFLGSLDWKDSLDDPELLARIVEEDSPLKLRVAICRSWKRSLRGYQRLLENAESTVKGSQGVFQSLQSMVDVISDFERIESNKHHPDPISRRIVRESKEGLTARYDDAIWELEHRLKMAVGADIAVAAAPVTADESMVPTCGAHCDEPMPAIERDLNPVARKADDRKQVEQLEQPKIKLPTNPDVAEVWNAIQVTDTGKANVAEICRRIAEKRGCNAGSLRTTFNRWRRQNTG